MHEDVDTHTRNREQLIFERGRIRNIDNRPRTAIPQLDQRLRARIGDGVANGDVSWNQRVLAEIRAGTVGQVQMVTIREHRFPFLVKIGDWNRFNRDTGGTLVEKCCHFFDLMNLLVDDRAVRVMASGAQDVNHVCECYNGEVPDIFDEAFVIIEYKHGARSMLDLCMFAGASRNEQDISVVGRF